MGKTDICPIYLLRPYEEQQQKIMKILYVYKTTFLSLVPLLPHGHLYCRVAQSVGWGSFASGRDHVEIQIPAPAEACWTGLWWWDPKSVFLIKTQVLLMSIRVWECWSVVCCVWTATSSLYFCSSTTSATFSPLFFLLFFLVISPDHLFGFTPVEFL